MMLCVTTTEWILQPHLEEAVATTTLEIIHSYHRVTLPTTEIVGQDTEFIKADITHLTNHQDNYLLYRIKLQHKLSNLKMKSLALFSSS